MKDDLKSLIYEKFNINLVLQMIPWEQLSKAVSSACVLINFCDTVCIYSFQLEIELKFYFCFPAVHSQFSGNWLYICDLHPGI